MNVAERVAETVSRHEMLNKHDRLVVAVSGGADSVALLHVLRELAAHWKLSLTAAHLNHCIRGEEADLDEQFVKNLAADLALECIVERIDVPAIIRAEGGSLESVARRERYDFLGRAAAAAGAGKIAIGHTSDDQAETVLQRILTGTGIRGLGGIPPTRPLASGSTVRIIRPLIDAPRQEILRYLESAGCSYRIDASNRDVTYLRNRVRHVLLPQLERQFGPGLQGALIRLAAGARNQYNVIEVLAKDLLRRAQEAAAARLSREGSKARRHGLVRTCGPDGRSCFPLDQETLAAAHAELAVEALRLAAEDAGIRRLTRDHCRMLAATVTAPTGFETSLPGGKMVRAEYGLLQLIDRIGRTEKVPAEAELPIPGSVAFAGVRFSAEIMAEPPRSRSFLKDSSRRQEVVDEARLEPPLTIRTRRPGDRFRPLGAPGVRKLHDFLIDEKVPAPLRDTIPIVCDRAGIVWVVPHRIAHRVRITETTKNAVLMRVGDG